MLNVRENNCFMLSICQCISYHVDFCYVKSVYHQIDSCQHNLYWVLKVIMLLQAKPNIDIYIYIYIYIGNIR